MWHVWWRGEAHTGFWWGDLREKDLLENLETNENSILKLNFRKWDALAGTGLIQLTIRTGAGRL
jgi:hypothetical protein